jgi:hypothetical protein
MVDETKPAPVAVVSVGSVIARLASVLLTIRRETVAAGREAFDAVSQELVALEQDAKQAGITVDHVHDVIGGVVAHLQLDEKRPLGADISVAAPAATPDTPAV